MVIGYGAIWTFVGVVSLLSLIGLQGNMSNLLVSSYSPMLAPSDGDDSDEIHDLEIAEDLEKLRVDLEI